jgi:glutamine synthetase
MRNRKTSVDPIIRRLQIAAVPKSCSSNYDDTRGNFQSDGNVWSLGKLGHGNKESANVKPKAVLAYCREKGIKAVDIRFPDSLGRWRHFTIHASGLTEAAFEFGLGQESCLPGLEKDEQFPWILLPVSEARYLDPLEPEPTLVLVASIQDAWTGQEAWFDARSVALRAVEAFRGLGILDDLQVSTSVPFDLNIAPDLELQPVGMLAGGVHDRDFPYRSRLFHLAMEAGVAVERHHRGVLSSSEILLGAKSLVQACDDHMMLRSMIEASSLQQKVTLGFEGLMARAVWSFVKGAEPMLEGARGLGLSDLGWFAVGGILKHASALKAVAVGTSFTRITSERAYTNIVSDRNKQSLVAIEPMSVDPRYRSIVYRNMPVSSCPYLVLSSIAMAMLDGITQKIEPATHLIEVPSANETPLQANTRLAELLDQDSEFLMQAEVFSEALIQVLCQRLAASNTN